MADANSAETTLPLLGRYRIEGMLGEGGLGTVVKAYDTRLKRRVAIKTLKRGSYAEDPDQFRALEERFAREAEAGSRMGMHPNLVAVHDLIIDPDRTQYLILEYIAGGTLAERIARAPLPLADALRLAADVAHGLQSAHEMGLVHRDIKPANIFLAANGRAKVGDFGIAQIDDISGRTRTTSGHPGTPLYMSPEQERQTAYLRPASDQYSLGLVLFEMLTGHIYKRIGARQASHLLVEQPAPISALVNRMLADDPDDRYPAMADVIGALQVIERQRGSAATQILAVAAPPLTATSPNPEQLLQTRTDTPRVALHAIPAVAGYAPPPAIPTAGRYSRRVILIGVGGLVVAAGTAGAAMSGLRNGGGAVATATLPAQSAVAAVATSLPTAPPTTAPTATSAPPTATTAPAAPIIITAPPIIITATPLPTAIPTPVPLATATLQPLPPPTATQPPIPTLPPPPTATSRPLPTALPAQAQQVTWTDPQGRMQMTYPASWHIVPLTGQDEIFEVESGDGVDFSVYASPAHDNDAMKGVTAYRDRQNRRTDRSYVFNTPAYARLGGLTSAYIDFTSVSRQNAADVHTGEVDYVISGGWEFAFEFYTQGKVSRRQDDLQAMLRSISFGR